ncbi:hypothetical protein GN244_ATG16548 [Phytophthora infestans]|uniref:Uncharacterized protein n=1 Tax=Phytophthora infestans TaxID=4787 RepID=A0A833SSV6_PHYIN|nr:hypothetical protein GN244_ATG16548 [Phytophthora infestans]
MYDLELTEHDAPALTFSLPSSATRASVGEAVTKKSKKNKKNRCLPRSTAESAGILLAELSTQKDKTEVLVARGSLVKPVFETVSPVEENTPSQWKKELEFAEISDALLLTAERADKNGKRQKVDSTAEEDHPLTSERRALANSMAVVDDTTSFEDLDGDEDEEDELTLAERVEALRERVEGDVTAALSRAERDADAPEDKDNKPDASSLASVLEQALQARDNALLSTACVRVT